MTKTAAKQIPFASKSDAAIAAANRPLAGPVFVSPISAAFDGVQSGWYVGFPASVNRTLYGRNA